jgi:hypothetical protein
MPQVLNGKENVELSTSGQDKVSIIVNGKNGISISATDEKNTKIVVENASAPIAAPEASKKISTIQLLEPEITTVVETQIEAARIEHQTANDLQRSINPSCSYANL